MDNEIKTTGVIRYLKELDEYVEGLTDIEFQDLRGKNNSIYDLSYLTYNNHRYIVNTKIALISKTYLSKIEDFYSNVRTIKEEFKGNNNIEVFRIKSLCVKETSNKKYKFIVVENITFITKDYDDFKNIILNNKNLLFFGETFQYIYFNTLKCKISVDKDKDKFTIIRYSEHTNKKTFKDFPEIKYLI